MSEIVNGLSSVIKDSMDSLAEDAKSNLVEALYNRKLEDTSNKLIKKWDELESLKRDLTKVQRSGGSHKLYNEEGKVAQQLFSEEESKKMKDLKDKIAKCSTAIEKALAGDFSRL